MHSQCYENNHQDLKFESYETSSLLANGVMDKLKIFTFNFI